MQRLEPIAAAGVHVGSLADRTPRRRALPRRPHAALTHFVAGADERTPQPAPAPTAGSPPQPLRADDLPIVYRRSRSVASIISANARARWPSCAACLDSRRCGTSDRPLLQQMLDHHGVPLAHGKVKRLRRFPAPTVYLYRDEISNRFQRAVASTVRRATRCDPALPVRPASARIHASSLSCCLSCTAAAV